MILVLINCDEKFENSREGKHAVDKTFVIIAWAHFQCRPTPLYVYVAYAKLTVVIITKHA